MPRTPECCFWVRNYQRWTGNVERHGSHGDVYELNEVANETHYAEANSNSLAYLGEF
jgi:hypothetical protein